MKIILLLSVTLLFLVTPVYGQLLSDVTGLVNRLDVQTSGHSFEVKSVANFDIPNFEFDKDKKKLTLYITSGLENNLGELVIPQRLLGGDLTFYLNDQEYFPLVNTSEKISFVTLNFTGSGDNQLDIIGTIYLSGLIDHDETDKGIQKALQKKDTFDDSFNWVILAGFLVVIVAFVVVKIKKKNSS